MREMETRQSRRDCSTNRVVVVAAAVVVVDDREVRLMRFATDIEVSTSKSSHSFVIDLSTGREKVVAGLPFIAWASNWAIRAEPGYRKSFFSFSANWYTEVKSSQRAKSPCLYARRLASHAARSSPTTCCVYVQVTCAIRSSRLKQLTDNNTDEN